ncbi:hypothetical protein [Priestia taiwanensis]|uniref:YfjL-like N-terminal domain-containing protein n=1 Tax=Priestia taiwanensis TaxID=1347902 RepID=A0A917AKJ4_9BACI|nr:hypothetical protein [Priestia taiwanensis]MBM7362072.1 hypothetical protein [Priestia taiwanensis]GGE59197.1 hypothetical protein GCM10007140_06950 [Priestia taiwanensis]
MKWFTGIVLTIILVLGGSFIIHFTGLPWREKAIGKELQEHLEQKYNIKTNIKETYYNFKYGTYGAHFYEEGKGERLLFRAEKINDGIEDTYDEELWFWQLNKDVSPIVKKYISNLDSYRAISTTYGNKYHGHGSIPHYKDVGDTFLYLISLNKKWDEIDEQIVHAELFHVIQEVQKQNITNVDIELAPFFDFTKPVDPKRIYIPKSSLHEIKMKEDIVKYVKVDY